jgi:hypothetical protein
MQLPSENEGRRIARPLTDNAPAETFAEEAARAVEVPNAQSDGINPACGGRDMLGHSGLPCARVLTGRSINTWRPRHGPWQFCRRDRRFFFFRPERTAR